MPKLLFLSRVAFICNLCYLISFFFRGGVETVQPDIKSTVIVLGHPVAVFLNIVCVAMYAYFYFRKHTLSVPRWLVIFNLLFLIIQLTDLLA